MLKRASEGPFLVPKTKKNAKMKIFPTPIFLGHHERKSLKPFTALHFTFSTRVCHKKRKENLSC